MHNTPNHQQRSDTFTNVCSMTVRYSYRSRVSRQQSESLEQVFDTCRSVRNHALGHWRSAWRDEHVTLRYAALDKELRQGEQSSTGCVLSQVFPNSRCSAISTSRSRPFSTSRTPPATRSSRRRPAMPRRAGPAWFLRCKNRWWSRSRSTLGCCGWWADRTSGRLESSPSLGASKCDRVSQWSRPLLCELRRQD